jgi:ubiquinone/menaquinone biosynthesis C-methylase UbiE
MTVSFDRQAADFDLRAGLDAGVARRISAAVAELAPAGGGALLDLGAGTGQLGEHLVRARGARERRRYLGIDLSAAMLAVFRRKLAAGAGGALVQADAAAPWPIATGSVRLLFVSRAAHLLPPAVLVAEALRVASPEGAVAVFGGVRSPAGSLRAILRRRMRRLLAEHGVEGRNASAARRRLIAALAERGGEVLPVRAAASWRVVHRAGDALAAWRAKPGLGGRAVTPRIQGAVLEQLETWILNRYGGLDVSRHAVERYELAAVRLPRHPETDPRRTTT